MTARTGETDMNEKMQINIMLLVGSNGKATGCVEGAMGWGDLEDGLMAFVDGVWKDPDETARYLIKVEVDKPSLKVLEPLDLSITKVA